MLHPPQKQNKPPSPHLLPSPPPSVARTSSTPPPALALARAFKPAHVALAQPTASQKRPRTAVSPDTWNGPRAVDAEGGKGHAALAVAPARAGPTRDAQSPQVIDLTLDDSDDDDGDKQPSRQSTDRHASKKPRVQSTPPRARPPEPAAIAVPLPPPRPPRPDRQRLGQLWSRAPTLPPTLPKHPVGHRFLPSGAVLPSHGPRPNPSLRDFSHPPTPGRLLAHQPHASTSRATGSLTPVLRPSSLSPESGWDDLERDPTYLHHLHPDDTRPSSTLGRDVYTSRAHPSTSNVRDLDEDRRADGITGRLVGRRWMIAILDSGGDDGRASVPDAWGGAGRRAARVETHAQEQQAMGLLTIGYAQLALHADALPDEEESE